MSKEDSSSGVILVFVIIIGILIYLGKSRNKLEIYENDSEVLNNINGDSLIEEDTISVQELIKNGKYIGTVGYGDLTTEEGVREAIYRITTESMNNKEINIDNSIAAIHDEARKQKICKGYTQNAMIATGMKKSFFSVEHSIIIQNMYISDMVGGYGKKYRLMAKEAKEPGYIDLLAIRTLKEYQEKGFTDQLDEQGFTEYQMRLYFEDGSTEYSKVLSIYE